MSGQWAWVVAGFTVAYGALGAYALALRVRWSRTAGRLPSDPAAPRPGGAP